MEQTNYFSEQQKKTLGYVGYILLFNAILILIQSYFIDSVKFESYIGAIIGDKVLQKQGI